MNLAQLARHATPRWLVRLTAIVVVLLLVGIVLPVFNTNNVKGNTTIQCERIGQVGLALHLYAGDNEDKLPAKLPDLSPVYLQPDLCLFHDQQTGKLIAWRYYGGHTLHDPADTILVASPVSVMEKTGFFMHTKNRIIATVDGHTELIPEAEFQRRVKASSPRQ